MATPEIQQLTQEMSQLTRSIQQMINASSRTVAAQQANYQIHLDLNDQLEDYKKQLIQGRTLNKSQQAQINEIIKLKRKELEITREYEKALAHLKRVTESATSDEAQRAKAADSVAKVHARLEEAQTKTTEAATKATESFNGLVKGTNLANAGLVWFGAALRQQGTQLLAQSAASSGVIEGASTVLGALFDQQNEALIRFRVSGAQLAEITAQNRQMINAMGGSTQSFQELTPAVTRLRILTGDQVEGLRLANEAATEFARKGIRPTTAVMEQYTNDVVQLQRMTGMSTRDAMALFNEIASDTDSIDLLRSARASEREAILRSQRALIEQSIAAGMSAEQAKQAAKMLNQMTAAKPLDRLKQAAKVRALGGALGIAGADEAAAGIAAGKRATAEQRLAMQEFSQNAANMMDQAAQQGMGTEIFASSLLEKLDLEQYYGKGSAFSTSLGETLKPAIDLQAAYLDVSNTNTGKTADAAIGVYQRLGLLLSGNHWGGVVAAGITALVGMVAGGAALGKLGSLGGRFGAAAGGAARGLGAMGATAAGAALKGIPLIGAGIDVGAGIYDLAQGQRQTEAPSGLGMLSPMRWAMYAGEKVNQGVESLTGDSLGGWLYGEDERITQMLNTPAPRSSAMDSLQKTTETSQSLQNATTMTAANVANQVRKQETTNDLLTRLNEISEKQLEAIKNLVPTEAGGTAPGTPAGGRAPMMTNRPQYNYVN